jgi:hypothetical protein
VPSKASAETEACKERDANPTKMFMYQRRKKTFGFAWGEISGMGFGLVSHLPSAHLDFRSIHRIF